MSDSIDVSCQVCGSDLGGHTVDLRRVIIPIKVPPCETCMEKAHKQGYDEGYDEGHGEGYECGLEEAGGGEK